MKRIIALIVVLIAIGVYAVLTYPSPEATADLPLTKTKYEIGPPDPTEMLELVNIEREKVGVPPLKYDTNVEKAAQLKADDFAERDYYSHIVKGTDNVLTPEMNELLVASCVDSSENINAKMITSQEAVKYWMMSKPHREAILDPEYTLTGLGVSEDNRADKYYDAQEYQAYYTVQHFCIAK